MTRALAAAVTVAAGIPQHLRTAPFVALAAIGFAVAVGGHLSRSRTAIVTGIVLLICATLLIPLAIYLTTK